MFKSVTKRFHTEILLVIALVFTLCMGAVAQTDKTITVAEVGDRVITEQEVEENMQILARQYGVRNLDSLPDDQKESYRKMILNRIVDRAVVMEAAEDMDIEVTDADIMEILGDIKDRFPSESAFEASLEQQGTNLKELKDKVRETIVVRKVIDKVTPTTPTVTSEEITEFYQNNKQRFEQPEEVKASHVLISIEQGASSEEKKEAEKKAEDILKKVKEGEDFGKLAQENSDCPSGKSGGDLGWFSRGKMVPPFEKAAFKLGLGEVSDVVETSFGYHIIKVTDKRDPKTIELSEAREDIKRELIDKKKAEIFTEWINEKKDGMVEFSDPEDAKM